jgi:hypothetical protein
MSQAPSRRVERKHRQRAANRGAIVDAARRVATREGAGDLSLRAVAERDTRLPVYEYFRNRAELCWRWPPKTWVSSRARCVSPRADRPVLRDGVRTAARHGALPAAAASGTRRGAGEAELFNGS